MVRTAEWERFVSTPTLAALADVRFQRADQATDPRWLQPWAGDDGY